MGEYRMSEGRNDGSTDDERSMTGAGTAQSMAIVRRIVCQRDEQATVGVSST